MPRTKSQNSKNSTVRLGNVSDVSGKVNIAGGNITTYETTMGLGADEVNQLFDRLYAAIDARTKISPSTRKDLKDEVKEIHSAVAAAAGKNTKLEESFFSKRFRNIARMAPDILDVVVATLANPLAGLGVAVKKIAAKAKEEIK